MPHRRLPHAALLLCLCAAPAVATDRDDNLDSCLIGRWEPDGNGAAEWMQRTTPGLRMTVTQQQGALELRADGHYFAHNRLRGQGTHDQLQSRGSMQGSFQLAGTWRTAEGRLTLVANSGAVSGQTEVQMRSGRRASAALPAVSASYTEYAYQCARSRMEIWLHIPGSSEPMVQRYTRAGR